MDYYRGALFKGAQHLSLLNVFDKYIYTLQVVFDIKHTLRGMVIYHFETQ